MKHNHINGERPQRVIDLDVSELKSLLAEVLSSTIEKVLLKVMPPRVSDEDIWLTTIEAADFLNTTRQTIQKKKSEGLIKFSGHGRIQRVSKAELKRYLDKHGVNAYSLKKAQKKNEEKRQQLLKG